MAPGRREAQRLRMRARLLTAAMQLFSRNGFEATTIDQIAEKADVARQTVLNHYPHKRDFLQAWGQQRRDQLLDLTGQDGPDEPARGQLHRYFAALARMNEGERELTRMLHVSLRHDDVLAHQRPVPEAVLAAIRRGQHRGELDPGADPLQAAEVLTAIYFDTLSRWLTDAGPPFDLQAMLIAKLDLVLAGLGARDGATGESR
jgi:AcrR family transcriptional regulator